MERSSPHVPIMVHQVVSHLITNTAGIYIDGTLGFGGHASAILNIIDTPGKLIGIDADHDVLGITQSFLSANFKNSLFTSHHANFRDFPKILNLLGYDKMNGILLDLGLSSYDIDQSERGFSFQYNGPLDMRYDRSGGPTAKDILNSENVNTISQIIYQYGEERFHKKIAFEVVKMAQKGQMNDTFDLKGAVTSVIWGKHQNKSIARVFQAIRIHVNNELGSLRKALDLSMDNLVKGGRIVILAFHSLEDRIVKKFFQEKSMNCICSKDIPICNCNVIPELKKITPKALKPNSEEINKNTRARSTRMRVAEKI